MPALRDIGEKGAGDSAIKWKKRSGRKRTKKTFVETDGFELLTSIPRTVKKKMQKGFRTPAVSNPRFPSRRIS